MGEDYKGWPTKAEWEKGYKEAEMAALLNGRTPDEKFRSPPRIQSRVNPHTPQWTGSYNIRYGNG